MRVLIIEDEPFLAESIQAGLRHEAIAADIALDGIDALERVAATPYDIVLLDRDIPGVHGDEVCRQVSRAHPEVRILMLTAASRLKDKVGGFELGADDYLTKPFAFEELVVRLRARTAAGGGHPERTRIRRHSPRSVPPRGLPR